MTHPTVVTLVMACLFCFVVSGLPATPAAGEIGEAEAGSTALAADTGKAEGSIVTSLALKRDTPWDPAALEDEAEQPDSGKTQVIYGTDDRKDWYEVTDPTIQSWSDSVCGMFLANDVWYNGDGTYDIATYQWLECNWDSDPNCDTPRPPCASEPFRDQPIVPFCTAFLVGPDLVATAGHCCEEESWLASIRFVFGFKMLDPSTPATTFDASYVYNGIELVGQANTYDVDYAIIRLDRPVTAPGAVPLPIRRSGTVPGGSPVGLIGHPSGLPLKISFGANTAVMYNSNSYYFLANLDSFIGSSGSPVFHATSGMVEGILVGGLPDYVFIYNCFISNSLPDDQGSEQVTRSTVFDHLVPQCGISVGEPNGGESWAIDSAQTIRWGSSGNSGAMVRIELYRGGSFDSNIAVSTPDDGEFPWTVPAGAAPGANYTVRITSTTNPSCSDFSNDPFTIMGPPVPLAEALDTTGLSWVTSGDADWFGQTDTFFHDGDAAESGNVSDSERSVLETDVTGPAEVRFHWKVSSEDGYDGLEFFIDGFSQNWISGEVDWREEAYTIPAGGHLLSWMYVKDFTLSGGADRGWVDYVRVVIPTPTVTPTGTPTPTVVPTATPTPVPGDVNGDGIVDGTDLFFFSQWWNSPTNQTNSGCDMVEDNVIDGHDLQRLIPLWKN